MKKLLIKSITIQVPFWLNWAKRFITLKCDLINQHQQLKGQRIDMLIIDEVQHTNDDFDKQMFG